ncbi:hypothetical protein KBC97_01000 [Candidatus Gracilibacteria bacterium]|nr:hypothetical protein [Candidatus Gracilibacteria bacterium]
MKKTLNIILAVSAFFAFTACGNPNQSADDAAKQAEVQKQVDELKEQVSKLKDEQDGVEHVQVAKTEVKTEIKTDTSIETKPVEPLQTNGIALQIANIVKMTGLEIKTEEKVVVKDTTSIVIDTPKDQANISGDAVTFTGTISAGATKIVAKSSADNDPYTLQSFKAGSKKFTYKAALAFKNLKVGKNTFEFTAYFKDGTTKTATVTINYSK